MADFSLSDMPWLLQQADAGTSLARGAAVGAQIAQNRNQRASLAQRRMEFEREQKLREQLLPMQQQTELLKAAARASEFVLKQSDREAAGIFGALAADITGRQAWALPESEGAIWHFASRYPQIAESDAFKSALQRSKDARQFVENEKQFRVPEAPPGTKLTSTTIHTPKGSATFRAPEETQETLPDIERIFNKASDEGMPFTPEAKQMARSIRLGLESRQGTVPATISEDAYVAKTLPGFLKTKPTKDVVVNFWPDKKERLTETEAIDVLRKQYRLIFPEAAETQPKPGQAAETIRLTKDGRKAVFDANTKQFLRYAD